jgi:hypothetical protein
MAAAVLLLFLLWQLFMQLLDLSFWVPALLSLKNCSRW